MRLCVCDIDSMRNNNIGQNRGKKEDTEEDRRETDSKILSEKEALIFWTTFTRTEEQTDT